MKHIVLILSLFLSVFSLQAQQDQGKIVNISIQPSAAEPGKFVIVETRVFESGDSTISFPATTYDSAGIGSKLFAEVWNAKAMISGAVEVTLTEGSVNQTLTRISQALNGFLGKTYFQLAEQNFAAQFAGVYRIRQGGTTSFVRFTDKGQAREVNQQGEDVANGKSGAYRIHSANFIELRGYLGVGVNTELFYLSRPAVWSSRDSAIRVKKIQ